MKNHLLLLIFIFVGISCSKSPKIIDNLGDQSFNLINQDSVTVTFPDDYKGRFIVMGFIYTNCPDICPLITQNLIRVQKDLDYPDDVQFLAISFDPKRDTPTVLKDFKRVYDLDKNFDFLTGNPDEVSALMDSVRVRTQISMSTTTESGREIYFLNHSDKIMVVDKKSRVIFEYGGSMTKPKYIVEDLNSVR